MLPGNFSQPPSPIALHIVPTAQGAWEQSRSEGLVGSVLMRAPAPYSRVLEERLGRRPLRQLRLQGLLELSQEE